VSKRLEVVGSGKTGRVVADDLRRSGHLHADEELKGLKMVVCPLKSL
jgi:hypothetical protein